MRLQTSRSVWRSQVPQTSPRGSSSGGRGPAASRRWSSGASRTSVGGESYPRGGWHLVGMGTTSWSPARNRVGGSRRLIPREVWFRSRSIQEVPCGSLSGFGRPIPISMGRSRWTAVSRVRRRLARASVSSSPSYRRPSSHFPCSTPWTTPMAPSGRPTYGPREEDRRLGSFSFN